MSKSPQEMAIDSVGKVLGGFAKFLIWIKGNDRKGIDERLAAVTAILFAATKTRQYTDSRTKKLSQKEKYEFETSISEAWGAAAREVIRFNRKLGEECLVKAYGWGSGVWDDPKFDIVPRKVEEVYADALKLLRDYQTILTEDTLH